MAVIRNDKKFFLMTDLGLFYVIIIVRHLMANKSDEVRKKYIYDV